MRPPENIKAGGGWSTQIYISSHTGMDLQISSSMCFCTAWTPSPVSLWHTLVMGNSCLLASSESNNSLYIMKGNLPSWCYLITWWYHSEHICSLCPQTACRPLKTVTKSLSFPTRSKSFNQFSIWYGFSLIPTCLAPLGSLQFDNKPQSSDSQVKWRDPL